MSSNRTKWTDFDKETKRYIKKRDGGKCVICGNEAHDLVVWGIQY